MTNNRHRNPFRRSDYRRWFLAETSFECSASLSLAVTLVLVHATGSVSTAGFIAGISGAVSLCATFLGGALGDALPRRRLLLVSGVCAVMCSALLVVLILVGAARDISTFEVVVLALLCITAAAVESFRDPVLDAGLKQIITPEEFPRAMSAAQARASTLSMAGAPIAGWLYSIASFVPFALRAGLDIMSLALVRGIRVDLGPTLPTEGTVGQENHPKNHRLKQWSGTMLSFFDGWRHLSSRAELFRLLLAAPLVNLTVFGTMSWVVYRLTADGYSSFSVGLVSAGFAIGGVIGAALTPVLTDRFSAGWLVVVGLGYTVCILSTMYFVPRDPWILLGLATAAMMLSPALNGALFGYVFAVTGEELQSRVMATFALIGGIASIVAPALASQAVMHNLDSALGVLVAALGIIGVIWLATSAQVRAIGR